MKFCPTILLRRLVVKGYDKKFEPEKLLEDNGGFHLMACLRTGYICNASSFAGSRMATIPRDSFTMPVS